MKNVKILTEKEMSFIFGGDKGGETAAPQNGRDTEPTASQYETPAQPQ